MTTLRTIRLVAWLLVAAAGGAIATILIAGPKDTPVVTTSSSGRADIGGPFVLTSQKGERVSDQTLRGKPYLAFFGFTHCPDICPTTLFELTEMMAALGTEADKFNVLLISVDPERDTQELLATYMTSFDPRIIALRGTQEETDKVIRAFKASAVKIPQEAGQYTMEHSVGVYLMDAEGNYAGLMRMEEPREDRLRQLRHLVAGS